MRILASPAFSNEKVNPYNALLYRELQHLGVDVSEYRHADALKSDAQLVHFHWPDGYINQPGLGKSWQRILLLGAIVCLLKLRGIKLVWTVHNTAPHDALHPRLSRWFMQWFIRRCDGFIFMSEANKAAFYQRYQPSHDSHYAIIPHGHYRNCYPAAIAPQEAKQTLGLNTKKKVLLFVGMIKPYKNIPGLMNAFNSAHLGDYQLVIAGKPDSPELREILENLKQPNHRLFLQFIPDDELNLYMSAADVVILPYKAILNSGALLLALSYNRPVIAPHMGAVADLQKSLGSHWIYGYTGELTSACLQHALIALENSTRPQECPLDNYDWDKLARSTLDFYRQLTARPGKPALTHS
ncbi:glycosyltransferase family 4 protein [Cellvibrio sp. UBA7661]|uniref:glycosyltransferase family 4 protein n=1 Tax=Cellvibrio sp. UBA7661 TaxID=1946311 RepID=UPI002F356262